MSLFPEWLWPVAILAGLGGFIDFLLGKVGRAKLVAVLEDWWVHFDDVSRNNFTRKEAEFAISVLDRWFGARFFCIRRFLVCTGIMIAWWTFGAVRFWNSPHNDGNSLLVAGDPLLLYGISLDYNMLVVVVSSFFGLSLSMSFSRRVAIIAAGFMTTNGFRNLSVFLSLLLITYVSMAMWLPITATARAEVMFSVYFQIATDWSALQQVFPTFF